jgi:hypothetical protein
MDLKRLNIIQSTWINVETNMALDESDKKTPSNKTTESRTTSLNPSPIRDHTTTYNTYSNCLSAISSFCPSCFILQSCTIVRLYLLIRSYPLLTGVRCCLRASLALHRGDEFRFICHARPGWILVFFRR